MTVIRKLLLWVVLLFIWALLIKFFFNSEIILWFESGELVGEYPYKFDLEKRPTRFFFFTRKEFERWCLELRFVCIRTCREENWYNNYKEFEEGSKASGDFDHPITVWSTIYLLDGKKVQAYHVLTMKTSMNMVETVYEADIQPFIEDIVWDYRRNAEDRPTLRIERIKNIEKLAKYGLIFKHCDKLFRIDEMTTETGECDYLTCTYLPTRRNRQTLFSRKFLDSAKGASYLIEDLGAVLEEDSQYKQVPASNSKKDYLNSKKFSKVTMFLSGINPEIPNEELRESAFNWFEYLEDNSESQHHIAYGYDTDEESKKTILKAYHLVITRNRTFYTFEETIRNPMLSYDAIFYDPLMDKILRENYNKAEFLETISLDNEIVEEKEQLLDEELQKDNQNVTIQSTKLRDRTFNGLSAKAIKDFLDEQEK